MHSGAMYEVPIITLLIIMCVKHLGYFELYSVSMQGIKGETPLIWGNKDLPPFLSLLIQVRRILYTSQHTDFCLLFLYVHSL